MTGPPLVFLDANILFSAAPGGPVFEFLLDLAARGAIRPTTSRACVIEAETNLERKRQDRHGALAPILAACAVEADVEADEHLAWAGGLVGSDDVHVLAAARRTGGEVLLTGDTTHFGKLMERTDLGLKVRTPRGFLLEGPGRLRR